MSLAWVETPASQRTSGAFRRVASAAARRTRRGVEVDRTTFAGNSRFRPPTQPAAGWRPRPRRLRSRPRRTGLGIDRCQCRSRTRTSPARPSACAPREARIDERPRGDRERARVGRADIRLLKRRRQVGRVGNNRVRGTTIIRPRSRSARGVNGSVTSSRSPACRKTRRSRPAPPLSTLHARRLRGGAGLSRRP